MTCLAAVFMRLSALMSLGLWKSCALENLRGKISMGGVGRRRIPMETTAVDADDNPCVWEEGVVLLKELDVLVARVGHGSNGCVEADEQDRPGAAGQCAGREDAGEVPEQNARKREERREGATAAESRGETERQQGAFAPFV